MGNQNKPKSIQQQIVESMKEQKNKNVKALWTLFGTKRRSQVIQILRRWFMSKEEKEARDERINRRRDFELTPSNIQFRTTEGKEKAISFAKENGIKFAYSGKSNTLYLENEEAEEKLLEKFGAKLSFRLSSPITPIKKVKKQKAS